MAVFTKITQAQLEDFLSSYNIGNLVSYEGIEAGVSNTNYFVDTDRGRYVLTLFEPRRVEADDISFFMDYTITLEENGVPCPRTMLRNDKTNRGILNDRPAAIFSFLEGRGAHVDTITETDCERAGEVLAQMHLAAQKIIRTSPNRFSLKRWQDWVTMLGTDMDKIFDGTFKYAADELDWVASRWPSGLPSGAIHADYFPDNVFFQDGDVSGVIDFHFVCTDMFAYDLAIALNAWSFDTDNKFDQSRFSAMMRGYNSVRPLSKEELNALPVLLRAAALRFLLSRIEEKLNWKPDDFMKPHDPMVFANRLRHFQTHESLAA